MISSSEIFARFKPRRLKIVSGRLKNVVRKLGTTPGGGRIFTRVNKIKNIGAEIIRLLLIMLFVYAAASKVADLQKFQVQMGQSPLLTRYARWMIYAVPSAEVGIAAALCFPRFKKWGLYASFTLMALFTLYIVSLLTYSSYVPCSCGGILQNMSWNTHIWFNSFFVLLSVTGLFLEEDPQKHFVAIK
jgi:uncharacterized membrane protein YphA (DoxX/SURF4 family)